jgi:hypothetical protein
MLFQKKELVDQLVHLVARHAIYTMLAPLEREARIDAGDKIFCRKLPTVIYDRSVSTLLENVWRALIVSLFFSFIYDKDYVY